MQEARGITEKLAALVAEHRLYDPNVAIDVVAVGRPGAEVPRGIIEAMPASEAKAKEAERHNAVAHKAMPYKVAGRRVSRNEPCPCGSQRKFKRCHGQLGYATVNKLPTAVAEQAK